MAAATINVNAELFPTTVAGFKLEKPLSPTAQHNYAGYVAADGRRGYVTAADLQKGLRQVWSTLRTTATGSPATSLPTPMRAPR